MQLMVLGVTVVNKRLPVWGLPSMGAPRRKEELLLRLAYDTRELWPIVVWLTES